jgi:hypothetical protein
MGSNENQVVAAIRRMAIEQRWMATRDITVEDFRQLFIPAEYRHSLKEAFNVAAPLYTDQTIQVPITLVGDNYPEGYPMPSDDELRASFTWDRNGCPEGFFAMTKEHKPMIQPDAPQELVAEVRHVSDNLMRISFEFGLVNRVFHALNTHNYCNTPQQMRFVWPAIKHICDKAGLKDLGAQLTETSARAGDRDRVPVDVPEYMVPTVNIVNRTTLLDKIEMTQEREFKLTVNDPTFSVPISKPVDAAAPNLLFKGMQ